MWRWPHFTKAELSDPSGAYIHVPDFLDRLEFMRRANGGVPLKINSGHRSPEHNESVGGASKSQHLVAAADISLEGHDKERLYRAAKEAGFLGIGRGESFIHVDLRLIVDGYQPPRDRVTVWYYGPESKEIWNGIPE